jgi:hypothetical protein
MPAERKTAVLSADVIGSSQMTTADRKKFQTVINGFSRQAVQRWPDLQMQQYRGDSLQAIVIASRYAGLRIGLLLHSYVMKEGFFIRQAIGLGSFSFKGRDIITSDGSAFRASGPYLDLIRKNGELISVAGDDIDFTNEWQTHSASLNFIIRNWTLQQAEAVYWQLQDFTQQQMARKLKIKQPSVHQRLQGAGWPAVQKILQRFESVVPSL